MGFGDFMKRAALGIATGGLSEVVRWAMDDGRDYEREKEVASMQEGQFLRDKSKSYLAGVDSRGGIRINSVGRVGDSPQDVRKNQMGLAGKILNQANQRGPSIASEQFRQGMDANINQQQALARSGRGNQALAARSAARNVAQTGQSLSGQAMIGRMQEEQNFLKNRLAAQSMASGIYSGVRQQDLAFRGQDINQRAQDMQKEQAQAQLTAQLRQMDDVARQAYLSQLSAVDRAELEARMGIEMSHIGKPSRVSQLLGAAGPVIAALAEASDEKLKKNVKPSDDMIDEFLKKMNDYSFKYKDESYGEGERLGVMAQDLEKSDLGKSMVVEDKDGNKMIKDTSGAHGLTLASLARLDERLRELEGK